MPENKKDDTKASDSVDVSSVEKAIKEEQEQGYRGVATDPTPRENYSVAGVTSGAPTPETDDKAAAEARKAAGTR